MAYHGITLKNSITIGKIYSIHYFEYMNNFFFEGESHNFWEFVCVDKGEVNIIAGKSSHTLKKGDVVFHQPNEFHNVSATGKTAPNLVVISFQCDDEAMRFFQKRILRIDEMERNLLANIIIEARRCFDCRLDDPYLQNMPQKKPDIFGAEQMIHIHLTHFLIHLLRRYSNPFVPPPTVHTAIHAPAVRADFVRQSVQKRSPRTDTLKATKSKSDNAVFNRVVDYLEANLSSHVTIEQICHDNLIGRSQLQKLFKERCNMGIIEYFSLMRINAAKEMIRTNHMNFTQIAEHLGYTSIHYFSRQFKKTTGMTPSEYASSIKAMADGSF